MEEEISQITMIERYAEGRTTLREVCERFDIHRTTVWRQLKALRQHGRAGLIHKLTGRPSNRSKPEAIRRQVLETWEKDYKAQGCKIFQFYQTAIRFSDLKVSYTTVRRWLKAAGLVK